MIVDGFREFSRLAAADGAVLIKNENHTLPVRDEKTALFGRCQIDYFKSGTGSGGAVNSRYVVNILEGFRKNPHIVLDNTIAEMYETLTEQYPSDFTNRFSEDFSDTEFDIPESVIKEASVNNDKAVIVIGRASGEGYDNRNTKGSFLLTDNECKLIRNVKKYFAKFAVLLNTGNIINMSWVEEYDVPAVMYIWQGGEEGGDAVADIVSGDITPSGRLTDTIAESYECYPSSANFGNDYEIIYQEDIFVGYRYFETFASDKVKYPFGFGLSYTDFEIKTTHIYEDSDKIELTFEVRNIGAAAGREVVQVYIEPVSGKLTRPKRELAGFVKTGEINPGNEETVTVSFEKARTAAYDDLGVTGYKSAWVLEKGEYNVYAGINVRDAVKVYTYTVRETAAAAQLTPCMAPLKEFRRMININGKIEYESPPVRDFKKAYDYVSDENAGIYHKSFGEAVKEGCVKEFVSSLNITELASIVRGEGMLSPKVTFGTASCFGGVTESLIRRGIPAVCTADGPSGIRMDSGEEATSMPCGTLLACTWDTELVEKLYEFEGKELVLNKIDMLLGPGMNIHRDPLCGRNFEYYSEDPLLTGVMGAAAVRGMAKSGSAAVIKHFACNNREYNRSDVNSIVSERALREIYLRGFEIAVKTSPVVGIMTSYNLVNGYHSASNYELTTSILRNEWHYDGLVMTDWWAKMNYEPETEGSGQHLAAMVKAQNDIFMVVRNFEAETWEDDISESLTSKRLSKGELQRCAENILTVVAKLLCFKRKYGFCVSFGKSDLSWFGTIKKPAKYDVKECSAARKAKKKTNIIFTDMIDMAQNEITHKYENVYAAPGSEVVIMLIAPRAGKCSLEMEVSSKESELAQLGIFIYYEGEQYSIPFRGTRGISVTVPAVEFELKENWHEMRMIFGTTNVTGVSVEKIRIRYI